MVCKIAVEDKRRGYQEDEEYDSAHSCQESQNDRDASNEFTEDGTEKEKSRVGHSMLGHDPPGS